jgi:hypothetical protein
MLVRLSVPPCPSEALDALLVPRLTRDGAGVAVRYMAMSKAAAAVDGVVTAAAVEQFDEVEGRVAAGQGVGLARTPSRR